MNSRSDKYMFVKHNLKYFNFKKFNNNKKILIEFSHWSSLHIASTYLLAILQKKFKANIIAYFASLNLTRPIKMSLKDRIKWILGNLFSVRFFGIFNSMGTTKFLWPNPNLINQSKINKIYNQKIRLKKL